MLSENDLKQIEALGISRDRLEWQLNIFRKGVPYINLARAATVTDGILRFSDSDKQRLREVYRSNNTCSKIKFVPASGAASRMFKSLFEYIDHDDGSKIPPNAILDVINNLDRFAFFGDLKKQLQDQGHSLQDLVIAQDYRKIVEAILLESGLNYGNLPKGLLTFHNYDESNRTACEEHLVEAAAYAREGNTAHLHFTVSPEHKAGFRELLDRVLPKYEERFKLSYQIDFSVQKPSTDTMAVDLDNYPFHNADGSILFRPGGHGALINNLNELDADLIFIKNIDNVVPEKHLPETVAYKEILGGILLKTQEKVFAVLTELDRETPSIERLKEIQSFIKDKLFYEINAPVDFENSKAAIDTFRSVLNRPIRVCGVVKNLGEPGGGPFWAPNSKGDISLQIIESSQVNTGDHNQMEIFKNSTHFNPVDLVCGVKDYKGNSFDLTRFVDESTCFISQKSKDGKDLKALELPGLWNGAMADWLTLFVEVPIETFNPVKMVNDLLRPMHQ